MVKHKKGFMKREKLLIFDCDGVLVDSEPLAGRVFIECLQKEGFDVDELYGEKFVGIALKDNLKQIEADFKRSVSDGFIETLSLMTYQEIKQSLQPIPDIDNALARLSNPRCIASGSDYERIKLSLEVTGLSNYFEHIFSATEVPNGKPFPDIFLYAARKMKYDSKDCIVIEDSYAGMQAGLAAEMKVLLYKPHTESSFPIPDNVSVFTDMLQLPSLVNLY